MSELKRTQSEFSAPRLRLAKLQKVIAGDQPVSASLGPVATELGPTDTVNLDLPLELHELSQSSGNDPYNRVGRRFR